MSRGVPEVPLGPLWVGAFWVILGATMGSLGFSLGVNGSILGRSRDAKRFQKLKNVDLEIDEKPLVFIA